LLQTRWIAIGALAFFFDWGQQKQTIMQAITGHLIPAANCAPPYSRSNHCCSLVYFADIAGHNYFVGEVETSANLGWQADPLKQTHAAFEIYRS